MRAECHRVVHRQVEWGQARTETRPRRQTNEGGRSKNMGVGSRRGLHARVGLRATSPSRGEARSVSEMPHGCDDGAAALTCFPGKKWNSTDE